MSGGDALWLLLFGMATARLTRLVTADFIFERFRVWADVKAQSFGYLVSCDWCLSIWFAVPMAFGWVLFRENGLVQVVVLVLAFSLATGLITNLEKKVDAGS